MIVARMGVPVAERPRRERRLLDCGRRRGRGTEPVLVELDCDAVDDPAEAVDARDKELVLMVTLLTLDWVALDCARARGTLGPGTNDLGDGLGGREDREIEADRESFDADAL